MLRRNKKAISYYQLQQFAKSDMLLIYKGEEQRLSCPFGRVNAIYHNPLLSVEI
jgi:hypothetical protein